MSTIPLRRFARPLDAVAHVEAMAADEGTESILIVAFGPRGYTWAQCGEVDAARLVTALEALKLRTLLRHLQGDGESC